MMRRHMGYEPRNNGAGHGVIRPDILIRPVIALSEGSPRRRSASPRVLAARRRGGVAGRQARFRRLRYARFGGAPIRIAAEKARFRGAAAPVAANPRILQA